MWRYKVLISIFIQFSYSTVLNSSILIAFTQQSRQANTLHTSVVWDDCTQSVYYIDNFATIYQPSIFRYDFKENRSYGAYFNGFRVSFIVPARECTPDRNLFVVGVNQYAGLIEWDGKSPRVKVISPLYDIKDDNPSGLISFARQNENGRLFFTTLNAKLCAGPTEAANASLYSYSIEKGVQRLAGGFALTTGLAFNSGKIYHIDSCKRIIIEFSTDSKGKIFGGRIVFDFRNLGESTSELVPVGLETDSDGNLYTSIYTDGSEWNGIWKVDPKTATAQLVARLPVNGVSGLVLGGPQRNQLFAVAGPTIINVNTLQTEQRMSRRSRLYKIVDVGGTGRIYKRANV